MAFAHRFETVFDEVRANRMELTDPLVQLLLRSCDHLYNLVAVARDGGETDQAHHDMLIEALDKYIPEEDSCKIHRFLSVRHHCRARRAHLVADGRLPQLRARRATHESDDH